MKIYSWNVNGIRAVVKKGLFYPFLEAYQPDILCLQETKAERGQIEIDLPDYCVFRAIPDTDSDRKHPLIPDESRQ